MTATTKIQQLGVELPDAPKPVGAYIPAIQSGHLIFTSGQIPFRNGQLLSTGKVPTEVSMETAQEAARQCVLNALAAIAGVCGTVDRIARVVRINAFVNSAEGFTDQAKVANAASELLLDIFGEAGRHTRCALGAAELPLNAPVEIDLIVEVQPSDA